jgi:hypothetical protein
MVTLYEFVLLSLQTCKVMGCAAQNICLSSLKHLLNIREFCKNISTGAQYVTLDNKVKCLSLALFFGNPTNKTVTGTAYIRGLLIAN